MTARVSRDRAVGDDSGRLRATADSQETSGSSAASHHISNLSRIDSPPHSSHASRPSFRSPIALSLPGVALISCQCVYGVCTEDLWSSFPRSCSHIAVEGPWYTTQILARDPCFSKCKTLPSYTYSSPVTQSLVVLAPIAPLPSRRCVIIGGAPHSHLPVSSTGGKKCPLRVRYVGMRQMFRAEPHGRLQD